MVKAFTPREIHKGLHVSFIEDQHAYYLMTSFDIRFTLWESFIFYFFSC